MRRRAHLIALASVAVLVFAASWASAASASRYVRYGVQDDAWLSFGPGGTIDDRLDLLDRLGVDVVRYTLRWDRIAVRKPSFPRDPADPAYDWGAADALLKGLDGHGVMPVVTITGVPGWANGGRSANWAPSSKWAFAAFAYAAAARYPFVRRWTIGNEPNQRISFRPTVPGVYVRKLLNPGYAAIKAANPRALVAGGVTAPRGGRGGVSPLDWIAGMGEAGATLDAYAHNPYPLNPKAETPFTGGCGHCRTATMATMPRLIAAVRKRLGPKRIWLTEYGYQTNPPDAWLGVSLRLQARYLAEAALRAWQLPYVDILINFMLRDDVVNARFETGHWQSGLMTAAGRRKPSFRGSMLPLAQISRRGLRTVLWGQVRPGLGRRPYVLQRWTGHRWVPVGSARRTGPGGMFRRVVRAGKGAELRLSSPRDGETSPVLVVQ